jgi:hypothetical protein
MYFKESRASYGTGAAALGIGDNFTGTVSSSSNATPDSDTLPSLIANTSAVANNVAFHVSNSATAYYVFNARTQFFSIVQWNSNTNVRCWTGVTTGSGATMGGSDAPAATSYCAFRFSTNAGDTTWQAVCANAGVQTLVDTGIAFGTTSKAFAIEWDLGIGSVYFYIDNVLVATISSANIPPTTSLAFFGVYLTTLNAAAKSYNITEMAIRQAVI